MLRGRPKTSFTISGRLLLPAGTSATACRGLVSVQIKHGARTVAQRQVTLRGDCTYRDTVTILSSAPARARPQRGHRQLRRQRPAQGRERAEDVRLTVPPTVAVVSEGGVGKTSISGTLARLLSRRGHPVLAIDGDPNPNLALALGVLPGSIAQMPGLSAELVEYTQTGFRLTRTLEHVCSEYALQAPDGVRLLAMHPPQKAGTG